MVDTVSPAGYGTAFHERHDEYFMPDSPKPLDKRENDPVPGT